ncbi:MAG: chemotaxis protein [Sulfurimonas sp.]|nr:chemotaxis protein [Sulfurimonas sp.]
MRVEKSNLLEKQKDSIILPMPATDENKMVCQLDDVTKESEAKATQIFDIIDDASSVMIETEQKIEQIVDILQRNINLFMTLHLKFPNVLVFKSKLEKNRNALELTNKIIEIFRSSRDAIMNVMDIMQYQDIHRQKIERVVNVMRSLSAYMNNLLEGRLEDAKRVASAQHIIGDSSSEVVSNNDIEELLAQFKS